MDNGNDFLVTSPLPRLLRWVQRFCVDPETETGGILLAAANDGAGRDMGRGVTEELREAVENPASVATDLNTIFGLTGDDAQTPDQWREHMAATLARIDQEISGGTTPGGEVTPVTRDDDEPVGDVIDRLRVWTRPFRFFDLQPSWHGKPVPIWAVLIIGVGLLVAGLGVLRLSEHVGFLAPPAVVLIAVGVLVVIVVGGGGIAMRNDVLLPPEEPQEEPEPRGPGWWRRYRRMT